MVIRVGEKPNGSTNAPAFGPRKRPKGVKIPEAMVFSVYPAGKDPKRARITHASNYPIIFKRFFLCDQCFCRQGALYFIYKKVCYPTILKNLNFSDRSSLSNHIQNKIIKYTKKTLLWTLTPILILLAGAVLFMNLHPTFGDSPNTASLNKISQSKHYHGGHFHNLVKTDLMTESGVGSSKYW